MGGTQFKSQMKTIYSDYLHGKFYLTVGCACIHFPCFVYLNPLVPELNSCCLLQKTAAAQRGHNLTLAVVDSVLSTALCYMSIMFGIKGLNQTQTTQGLNMPSC